MNEDLTELKITSATHGLKIDQIVENIASHFHNQKQRDEKIFDKLEQMPDEDRIVRLFAREAEKLAAGIVKRADEQQQQIDDLKSNQKYVAGFGAGVAGVLTVIWNMFGK